jgi:hypothetical protein
VYEYYLPAIVLIRLLPIGYQTQKLKLSVLVFELCQSNKEIILARALMPAKKEPVAVSTSAPIQVGTRGKYVPADNYRCSSELVTLIFTSAKITNN